MSKRNSLGLSKGSLNGSQSSDKRSGDKSSGNKDNPSKGDGDGMKKPKLAFGIKPTANLAQPKKGIQIKLGAQKPSQPSSVKVPSKAVAAAFNDDDEEPEEMPPEARMRMRNIGRETPTSAGPNSFGKTKQGFCDAKKMFEKTMKKAMDNSAAPVEPTDDSE